MKVIKFSSYGTYESQQSSVAFKFSGTKQPNQPQHAIAQGIFRPNAPHIANHFIPNFCLFLKLLRLCMSHLSS